MFKNVMLVCIDNNVCRSPICDEYLNPQQSDLNFFTSWLGILVDKSTDKNKIELMVNNYIDLNEHLAQQIDSIFVSSSDLILTIKQNHVDATLNKFPESRGKVHPIGKWDDKLESSDLYKKDMEAFEASSAMVEFGLDEWNQKLWC